MTLYNIIVTNDMGHLRVFSKGSMAPEHIISFVNYKIKNKINCATDNESIGCMFFILKRGLDDTWTYHVGNDTIIVKYQLHNFNPKKMIYTENI